MTDADLERLNNELSDWIGKPLGAPGSAPEEVNVPMIRHWVDALDDRNPVYLDPEVAERTRFGGVSRIWHAVLSPGRRCTP